MSCEYVGICLNSFPKCQEIPNQFLDHSCLRKSQEAVPEKHYDNKVLDPPDKKR
jgi:hypothetical protein